MNKDIEKILVDLIKAYLVLPDNYGEDKDGNEIPTVVIRGQNHTLPIRTQIRSVSVSFLVFGITMLTVGSIAKVLYEISKQSILLKMKVGMFLEQIIFSI